MSMRKEVISNPLIKGFKAAYPFLLVFLLEFLVLFFLWFYQVIFILFYVQYLLHFVEFY